MKAAILGATRGMGRALARELVAQGHQVFLLGRDTTELEKSAADLGARGSEPSPGFAQCDLDAPEGHDAALQSARDHLGGLDLVVLTAARFGTQDQLEEDPEAALALLRTNFAHSVAFCESARRLLMSTGGGTLCVFSSVAGERGRKPVVLYGATKAGLSAYLEGLDHRYRASGLTTVCVKPGFVRTEMTAGLPEPPFAGDPGPVAVRVLRAIEAGKPVVYAPPMWALVMMVIRALPRFVMRRVGF